MLIKAGSATQPAEKLGEQKRKCQCQVSVRQFGPTNVNSSRLCVQRTITIGPGHRALCSAKLAHMCTCTHIGFKLYRATRLNRLYLSVINDILKHFLAWFLLEPDRPCSGHKYSDLEVPQSILSTVPLQEFPLTRVTSPHGYKSPALLPQYGRYSGMS